MKRDRVAMLVAAAFAAACSERSGPPPAGDAPPVGGVGLTCIDVAERGLMFEGATREAITAELGLPERITATSAGATGADSLFVMEYPGLRISLHKPAGGGELADEARVTDNRYLRYPAAGIGVPADSIVTLLGEPNAREADRLVYVCHGDSPRDDPLAFVLDGGRVRELIYTWYMD